MDIRQFSVRDTSEASKVVSILREDVGSSRISQTVSDIIADVAAKGDQAVIDLTRKFDSESIARPEDIIVSEDDIETAYSRMNASSIKALKVSARQIREFSRSQISRFKEISFRSPLGFTISESYAPFESVGGYVPGGLAAYPSTVLMICIPAKEAGVHEIVITSPPRKDGTLPDSVLAAAKIGGASKIYKIGGAQAIAAMALGSDLIHKVDIVVGPGNEYVTEAKRQLSMAGKVLIDGLAGPTELLVIADESAKSEYIAEDLISQAEHGNRTLCGVATTSEEILRSVLEAVSSKVSDRPRMEFISKSVFFGVLASNEALLIEFSRLFSPEHLEVMTIDSKKFARKISSNAGLVLLGDYAPCSSSDYIVGTNHILPTGGEAAFHSGLSVSRFLKRSTMVSGNSDTLRKGSRFISTLAMMEGFPNHAAAPLSRFVRRKAR